MPYRYRSVAKALAAAQRMANRTGRPIKVLVQNPRQKYPKKLASKYIRQEFHAGRKGKQAVAIGIARARRAASGNPGGKGLKRTGRSFIDRRKLRSTGIDPLKQRERYGGILAQRRELEASLDAAMGRTVPIWPPPLPRRRKKHNPEWLTGAMPRKLESGQHMRRAAKRNPTRKDLIRAYKRADRVMRTAAGKLALGSRRSPVTATDRRLGDLMGRAYQRTKKLEKVIDRRRNPEWLTGAVPRKVGSGHQMTRFFDSGRKLRAEMFETGNEAPRLLVYNPAWKPRRKSLVRKKFQTRRTRRTRRAGVAGLRKRR